MVSLYDALKRLITEADARAPYSLLNGQDVDAYVDKLKNKAEVLTWLDSGDVIGVIAFYCNDPKKQAAFITMVLVDPKSAGRGIGRALTNQVLSVARSRGFASVKLSVHRDNFPARRTYEACGFEIIDDTSDYLGMEATL
jgi:ribosomal protein S18 acetylase RimI-like enzyme